MFTLHSKSVTSQDQDAKVLCECKKYAQFRFINWEKIYYAYV